MEMSTTTLNVRIVYIFVQEVNRFWFYINKILTVNQLNHADKKLNYDALI